MGEPSRAWIIYAAAELGRNSQNSSSPPSNDTAAQKDLTNAKKNRRKKKRRRPGGQKGHPGHHRPLVPAERVDERTEHHPAECRRCSRDVSDVPPDEQPWRHQIAEIPEIRPTVTEHTLHRVTCPDCNTSTTATLPDAVPKTNFGPNLRALIVLLAGRYRISRRETVDLCDSVFGLSVSVGSVDNILQSASEALAAPNEEVAAAVKDASVSHMDETGWREKGKRFHLWILVTSFCVLFRIGRRTKGMAQEMLGEDYRGTLVSDRYAAYRWVVQERHQVCWSHLGRDFEALVQRGGDATTIGSACRALHDELFAAWNAHKRGRIRWETMQRRMIGIEARMGEVLASGVRCRDPAARSLCKSLSSIEASLFVFARVPGVEPTNNVGERGIRPAVQWRKICFGTQSSKGSRFVERILTVVATCRQQGRALLPYLREVLVAADSGAEIPSILTGADERLRDAG
jgi:transposase